MIHTIVERFFQQLSTIIAASTVYRQRSSTSERNQTSCRNNTSASTLASRINFSWDVIPTRTNHNSFTNAYEIPSISKRLEHRQSNLKDCHKLDARTMGEPCTRLGTSTQDVPHTTSNSLPEPPITQTNASPGWAAGSPEESNPETH